MRAPACGKYTCGSCRSPSPVSTATPEGERRGVYVGGAACVGTAGRWNGGGDAGWRA